MLKPVAKRRSYHQHCGLARALDVVGERWTLLIIRDLLLGPRRYTDFLRSLDGITTNLLAERLGHLVTEGLIEQAELAPPGRAQVYRLTSAGAELEPAVMELARWGWRYLARPRRGDRFDPGWALLSMKRRYFGGLDRQVGFEVEGRAFWVSLGERMDVVEGALPPTEAVAALHPEAFKMLFFGAATVQALEQEGELQIRGDRQAILEVAHALRPPSRL